MKVLFMTNIPAPYRVTFFNQLAKKCDLTVLFEEKNNSIRNEEWYKDNTYHFKYHILKKNFVKELIQFLKEDFDIIIMGNYASKVSALTRFVLKAKKKRYIISADGGFAEDKFIFTKWIKTFFISSASYWLSTGKGTSEYLKTYGAQEANIYTFRFTSLNKKDILSKPLKYSEKMQLRKKLGYNYKRIFFSVGQLVYRKGYDIFLDIIQNEKVKDTAFLIAGVGEKMEEYKKYIEDNKIENVFFIGFKDKKEILELYKMSDVFFFPTRYDIWGLVINEAMANGLPIISSDKALAALELLPKNYLYSCNDKEKLLKLIHDFSSKEEQELYEIGKNNLNKIKDYTIEQMVEEHVHILEDIYRKIKQSS